VDAVSILIFLAGRERRGYSIHIMHDPFELVIWAIAIVFSWEILASATGLQDWIKNLVGRKDSNRALEQQIKALEVRVKELEQKQS
jgi:hypothetical protein